jgi:dihydroneopterin aldolase
MAILLPVGIYDEELVPQPLWVSVTASGLASAAPRSIDQCLDYEPLCDWLAQVWPATLHTPLLETRVNQLMTYVFTLDRRVQNVWIGLYKQSMSRHSAVVGIERASTRVEFETMTRTDAADMALATSR